MSIRWGFIGAGGIARIALAPAVHASSNGLLQAVASRDPLRSAALSPLTVHASYEDLINDPDVDAVYISLTNDQHRTWAIRAMQAGKDVLCEKPLALNLVQAQEMADVAQQTGRLLVEAMWARFHPRYIRAVQLVQSGAIGQLVSIDSAFTFSGNFSGNYRLDPTMGGGSLLDVGVYQLHLWSALTDGAPAFEIETVERNIGDTGVDLTCEITGRIADGVQVHALSSFEMGNQQHVVITGSKGRIEFLEGEAFTSWKQPSSLLVNEETEEFDAVDAYQLMVEAFGAKVSGEQPWLVPMKDTLFAMDALDRIASF